MTRKSNVYVCRTLIDCPSQTHLADRALAQLSAPLAPGPNAARTNPCDGGVLT
jgi:hypothetical protein